MAQARHATVRSNESLARAARLLRLDLPEGETLGDIRGGEYIIVHTGLSTAEGKPLKRTYSIVYADAARRQFELAVHPLAQGPASNHLGGLAVGETLTFSGPWGKKAAPDPDADVFLVGTDTGLSTLCGWTSGRGFVAWAPRTRALWLRHAPDGFCCSDWVRERVEPHVASLEIRDLPAVGSHQRSDVAVDHLASMMANRQGDGERPAHVVLSGDGVVLRAMKAWLLERGTPETSIVVEPFFNKPDKSRG